jgi:predicted DNA-binding transcriptional regulator AlpA
MTSGPMGDDEGLLTEEEVAALLQLPLPAVRRLRLEGAGPPCLQIGRQMRYRQAAVQRWLAGGLGDGSDGQPARRPTCRRGERRRWTDR